MPAADPTDVVIIGAGVIGCAIATELARRGHRTVNVERGAAAGAVLLGIAVWELCRKRVPTPERPVETTDGQQVIYVQAPVEQAQKPEREIRYRRPVPAAIARQRAHFAAEGRKMRARQRRQ